MAGEVRERMLGGGWRLVTGRYGSSPVFLSPGGDAYTTGDAIPAQDVAALLGVSSARVRQLRAEGRVEAFASKNTYEILVASIIDYMNGGTATILAREESSPYQLTSHGGYRIVVEEDGAVHVETPFGAVTGPLGEQFDSVEDAEAAIRQAISDGFPDLPIVGGGR
jgi:hypothetical protein